MKITRVIALAVIGASTCVAMAQAQSLRNAGQPAEFPPSSYKSTQYVDSRGCVYVRAGISGNVSWIPRVTRARKQICGQSPSSAGAVASAAPKVRAQKKSVQITLDAPTNATPAAKKVAKAIVKPKVRRSVAAAPKPRRVVVKRPAPVGKTVVVVAAANTVAKRPVATRKVGSFQSQKARVASACTSASATSQRYLGQGSRRLAVRCGPQKQTHYSAGSNVVRVAPRAVTQPTRHPQIAYAGTSAPTISGATRIVPKHVLVNRGNQQNVQVPEGYRTVWTDGRLNPKRAEQSLAGQAQIKLIWTNTVPRRLINAASGSDVTATTPLVYPYVDMGAQTRSLGAVSIVQRDGQVLKRIVRNSNAARVRQPVVSSRSAPAVKPKAVAAQFVNVGTYEQQGSAQSVAKRIHRMGLPVRIGKYARSGKTYRMVLVGPFETGAPGALAQLRSAGYHNAVLR